MTSLVMRHRLGLRVERELNKHEIMAVVAVPMAFAAHSAFVFFGLTTPRRADAAHFFVEKS